MTSSRCTCIRTYWEIQVLDPACSYEAHAAQAATIAPRPSLDEQG